MNFFKNFDKKNLIIAHRGFRGINVENSLEAFENSIEKSDFIEFDIQFTKDYIAVIHHDDTLKRLSNVKELSLYKNMKPWFIKDFYFEQIKDLRVQGTKIASLEEFLFLAKKRNIYFNLEIKDINKYMNIKKAIQNVLELIYKYKCQNLALISAFNHEYLKIIREKDKNISLAVLCENKKNPNTLEYLKSLDVQAYNISKSLVNEDLIKELKNENIETLVFTINDKKKIKKLFEIGVKGVFTDYEFD